MNLQILHVPDCPNAAVLAARIDTLLTGCVDITVEQREIGDEAEAAARGMTGSPTLLVDGVDPFAVAGQAASVSCRLYIDDAGAISGAPSVAQLRAALRGGLEPTS